MSVDEMAEFAVKMENEKWEMENDQ